MPSPSTMPEPSTAEIETALRGTTKQTRPTATGSHSITWITCRAPAPSRAHDQEVEAQGGEPSDQQQRVGADESGLGAAHDHADPADGVHGRGDDPLHHDPLQHRVCEAAG